VRSYAIIPLHGSEGKNGVLQLYNKKGGEIDKKDMKQFEKLQKSLGGILEYVLELNSALNYLLEARIITTKMMGNIVNPKKNEGNLNDCLEELRKLNEVLEVMGKISRRKR